MQKSLIAALPLILFALLGLAAAIVLVRGDDPSRVQTPVNRPVPDFTSDAFGPDELRGQVSVVNVFASWCLPCEAEHPEIMRLADYVPVYGINYRDNPQRRDAFLTRLGNPYRAVAVDEDGQIAVSFGVVGVPTTLVIDADGMIRYRHDMPVTPQAMDETILPLIRALSGEDS